MLKGLANFGGRVDSIECKWISLVHIIDQRSLAEVRITRDLISKGYDHMLP